MSLTAPERRETKQWLGSQGYAMELIDRPADRVQWYKSDGTPVGGLLPADPYHMQRYRGKGWRLTKYTDEQIEAMKEKDISLFKGELPNEPESLIYVSDKPKVEKKQRRKRKARKGRAGVA